MQGIRKKSTRLLKNLVEIITKIKLEVLFYG